MKSTIKSWHKLKTENENKYRTTAMGKTYIQNAFLIFPANKWNTSERFIDKYICSFCIDACHSFDRWLCLSVFLSPGVHQPHSSNHTYTIYVELLFQIVFFHASYVCVIVCMHACVSICASSEKQMRAIFI